MSGAEVMRGDAERERERFSRRFHLQLVLFYSGSGNREREIGQKSLSLFRTIPTKRGPIKK